ncbi:polymeric immunoglobulin receptor-like [Polymixia lowei]
MRTLNIVFLVTGYIHTFASVVHKLSVTGYKGKTVIINCQYNENESKEDKYFCTSLPFRVSCKDEIRSTKRYVWKHEGRFSLYDNPKENSFKVIIRDLNEEDRTTKYWCAVNKQGLLDNYSQVNLNILEDDCCKTSVSKVAYLGGSVTIDCKYPKGEENNVRYFCKKGLFDCKHLISTRTATYTKKDRFSLLNPVNEERIYKVNISGLTEEDAGTYWCAMKTTDGSISQLTDVTLSIVNWDDIQPKEETADTERAARLQCDYPDRHSQNEKFLCKGESPFTCKELINTTKQNEAVSQDRLSLWDHSRHVYFAVTITHSRPNDSGTYWCGSDRTWQPDNYTRIHLSVVEKTIKTETPASASASSAAPSPPAASVFTPDASVSPNSSSTTPQSAQNGTSVYIAGSLGLVLLVVVILPLLLIYRHTINKRRGAYLSPEQTVTNAENGEGDHGDRDYESIQERPEASDPGSAPPSIYVTCNFPTNPSDSLDYSTVSFHKSPDCTDDASVSTLTEGNPISATHVNGSSTSIYSAVRNT